jgi:hypothetical protein
MCDANATHTMRSENESGQTNVTGPSAATRALAHADPNLFSRAASRLWCQELDREFSSVWILRSLWARLTGAGGESAPAEPPRLEAIEYNGFRIRPAPYKAAGGYQTAGTIEKDFPEGMKEHAFIRAETHPSLDEAAAFAIAKGKQIIDQQGERVFK